MTGNVDIVQNDARLRANQVTLFFTRAAEPAAAGGQAAAAASSAANGGLGSGGTGNGGVNSSGTGLPAAQAQSIANGGNPSVVDINAKLGYQQAAAAGLDIRPIIDACCLSFGPRSRSLAR